MPWPMSPETEVLDGIEYRNLWQDVDEAAGREANALGARLTPPTRRLPADYWEKNLCVAAYKGWELIGIATGEIRFAQRVRANMAFLRLFVKPEHAKSVVGKELALKFHEIMRKFSRENPDRRLGGTMRIASAPGAVSPMLPGFYALIGYTEDNRPMAIRWFEHFKL
ncbi:MAG: hypothetical protein JOZ55_04610 [Alphaproteobacteria bacterium]|nr:hypothetical protein [Alphaproteobacteria bacterium]